MNSLPKHNFYTLNAEGICTHTGETVMDIYGRTWKQAGFLLQAMNDAYDMGRMHEKEACAKQRMDFLKRQAP